jgi:hypothetical protein
MMSPSAGSLFEGLIRYCFLGVTFALLPMLVLLILVYARDQILNAVKAEVFRVPFEKLYGLSDRLDEKFIQKDPYGGAMWLTPLIWIGITAAVGLLIILAIVTACEV